MTKFIHVDAMNTFFRCIHTAARGSDLEEKVSFALHSTLQSIAAAFRDQNADHVVIALEGRSWRKDYYPKYKADRVVKRAAKSEAEKKEAAAFFAGYTDLVSFLYDHANVTMLQHEQLEADDLIAGFIQAHPDDEHVINSSDSDFHQLLAENVTQFNGVTRELHTITGIYDHKGKPVLDKKTKLPKAAPDPKFILFEKCMRGDPTDNIFSAYPGVRTKGSKNKTGLIEAFSDRGNQGFAWNNLMLQRWVDPDGKEHKVLDDYNRNVTLVDLTAQPEDIKEIIKETVANASTPRTNSMVGAHFLKFCGKHNLVKLSEQSSTYAAVLGTPCPKV
jgi:5'-3' exonuclease